jgi:magnesium-transporting ATPase (P-type)
LQLPGVLLISSYFREKNLSLKETGITFSYTKIYCMDQDQSSSLFEMELDQSGQSNILAVSKWTRFISIVGIVCIALVLIALAAGGKEFLANLGSLYSLGESDIAMTLIVLLLLVVAFFCVWVFFLLKASNLLKKGIQGKNSTDIAEGFRAMKTFFILSVVISVFSILSTILNMLS